jgi:predicted acylesterase/phospholipase RssA
MKGGITSGVVYPGAATELAKTYRFRSIGGTSAGAIAAAAVAAAEYRRQLAPGRSGQGFVDLMRLPGLLASGRKGRPFLLSLFRPQRRTRGLFRVAIAFLSGGAPRGLLQLLLSFWRAPLLALAIAAGSICLSVFADARAAFAVAGVGAGLVLGLLGLGVDVVAAVKRLAQNDFGLCKLGPERGSVPTPTSAPESQGGDPGAAGADVATHSPLDADVDQGALTEWLHGLIQHLAGKERSQPLTFAQLYGFDEPLPEDAGEEARRERERRLIGFCRKPEQWSIDLQMMTTNLTHGRPLRLPTPYQPHHPRVEEGGDLLFDPGELRDFFPEDVVAHLERYGRAAGSDVAPYLDGRALRHFPIGPDLPVVVATRMSLSFPALIAAIPLWQVDHPQGRPARLRRVVFSDGGITSNFPVHFFDSPLPRRPTFGLHLAGFEPDEPGPAKDDPSRSVPELVPVSGHARESWVEIGSLFGFFLAIKDAMQNWRDNAQARLPGFRDRTAHIKLARGEGGLNLAMEGEKITELSGRGAFAGERLVHAFSTGSPTEPRSHWNDNRFVRFRTTMAGLERYLRSFEAGYGAPSDPISMSYKDRLAAASAAPYPLESPALRDFAEQTSKQYSRLARDQQASGHSLEDENLPRPPSTLRTIPPV